MAKEDQIDSTKKKAPEDKEKDKTLKDEKGQPLTE